MERAVGWFVMLALTALAFGFGYYLYNTAQRKGWFLTKAPYFTFVQSAIGLKPGDPVKLMGFDAGSITKIEPMPGDQFDYNVYVEFVLKPPNYGYIWTEGSQAKIATADFLGKRVLEVSKGVGGYPTYVFGPLRVLTPDQAQNLPDQTNWVFAEELYLQGTNPVARPLEPLTNLAAVAQAGYRSVIIMDANRQHQRKTMTGMWNDKTGRYDFYTNGVSKYWLTADESPAVTERLEKLVHQVEQALPGVFALTNQIGGVLTNVEILTSNLNLVATTARPAVSNLAVATANLDRPGALGDWLLPTNINRSLESSLTNASAVMATANTNLAVLAQNLNRSLDNLAGVTSNLNNQVQANTNLLRAISDAVVHADQLVQGLKRHWLLRSAFKTKDTNAPPAPPAAPLKSPKERSRR
jgi:ABC-type transporter Mla subunit MlaD